MRGSVCCCLGCRGICWVSEVLGKYFHPFFSTLLMIQWLNKLSFFPNQRRERLAVWRKKLWFLWNQYLPIRSNIFQYFWKIYIKFSVRYPYALRYELTFSMDRKTDNIDASHYRRYFFELASLASRRIDRLCHLSPHPVQLAAKSFCLGSYIR